MTDPIKPRVEDALRWMGELPRDQFDHLLVLVRRAEDRGRTAVEAANRDAIEDWKAEAAHYRFEARLLSEDLIANRAREVALREALGALITSVDDLIADSEGVYGLHLNGDPAPWSELTMGGQFEDWLIALEAARAAFSPTATGEGGNG